MELWLGPAHPDKSRRLVELCAARVREGRADSFLFIVPSPQRAAQVNAQLLDAAGVGLFKPFVDTFNSLIEALYARVGGRGAPISAAAKSVILQEILIADPKSFSALLTGPGGLPFPGLTAKLAELVSQLKRNLIPPERFQDDAAKLPRARRRKALEAAEAYARYQALLHEHDLIDEDGVFWLLIERLAEPAAGDALAGVDLLALDGIHDLTPAEWAVLRALMRLVGRAIAAVDFWPEGMRVARAAAQFCRNLEEEGAAPNEWGPAEPPSPRARAASANLFALPSRRVEPAAEPGELLVWRCRDRQHEVRAAARRIKELARAGAALNRIVVTAGDLSRYVQLIRELFPRYGVAADFGVGLPLAQAPAAAAVMHLLDAVIEGYPRRAVVNALRSPYFRFAPAPGADALSASAVDWISREAGVVQGRGEWSERIRRYEERLRREREELDDDPARERALDRRLRRVSRARPAIEKFLDLLARLEKPADADAFRETLRGVLERLEFQQQILEAPRLGLSPADTRRDTIAYDRFLRAVDSVAACTRFAPRRSYTLLELRDLLASALQETTFRPERSCAGVQVLNLRELRALEVDHLFVLGMAEGEFPRPARRDIFFSESEQKRLGMKTEPSVETEDRYLFYQCLARPERSVALSWPASAEGGETVRSSFVDEALRALGGEVQTPPEPAAPESRAELLVCLGRRLADARAGQRELAALRGWADAEPALAANVRRSLHIERERSQLDALSRFQGAVGAAARAWPHLDRPFSISMLETYGKCPFAFFMERMLGLKAPEEPTEELSAMQRGDVLHRVLRRYYEERRVRGRVKLTPDDDLDAERRRIKQIAEEVLAEEEGKGFFWDAERDRILGGPDAPGLLDRFIEVEAEDETACEPAYFEAAFGLLAAEAGPDEQLALPALTLPRGGEPQAEIVGKIDRIDLAEGSQFLVIDYKTGAAPGASEVNRGAHLQMPVYLMAVRQGRPDWTAVGGVYFQVKDLSHFGKTSPIVRKEKRDLFAGRGQLLSDERFEELLDACEKWILAYARWIRAGKFPPMKHADHRGCGNWCPYRDACRVDPARMTWERVVAALRADDGEAPLDSNA